MQNILKIFNILYVINSLVQHRCLNVSKFQSSEFNLKFAIHKRCKKNDTVSISCWTLLQILTRHEMP